MTASMRPLTLHVSALSDAEYNLYTASFSDLATTTFYHPHVRDDDAHFEQTTVGVREARAWLRGRFSDLPASDIEAILKLFCPNMLPTDTLTGGQFFAALRLVVHVDSGKGVDRTLAFVQASPRPTKTLLDANPRPLSPQKRPVQAPPSHPDRHKPPPVVSSSPETNPFTRRSVEHPTPPAPPPADPDPVSIFPSKRPNNKLSHNPFLVRDKPAVDASAVSGPSAKLPPLPPRKPPLLAAAPRRSSESLQTPIVPMLAANQPTPPPLVPVKPIHHHVMSPLMRQSLEASKHAQSVKRAEQQLDQERVLQVLKTTSSGSSSNSSNNVTPNARPRSLSPAKQQIQKLSTNGHDAGSDDALGVPPLPRRRKPSLPLSRSSSILSFEQVANATLPSPVAGSAFAASSGRPPLPSRDTTTSQTDMLPGPIPPPMHPHRRPSSSTATEANVDTPRPCTPSSDSPPPPPQPARLGRSNSLAAPSAAAVTANTGTTTTTTVPLPPPPRRKRPESVQLFSTSSDAGDLATHFPQGAGTTPTAKAAVAAQRHPSAHPMRTHGRTTSYQGGLSRHLSLTRERDRVDGMPSSSLVVDHHHSFAGPQSQSPPTAALASLQKTFANLQLKAQPKLDAVRYKAEAGLSRRGYMHHPHFPAAASAWGWKEEEGEEGLMADVDIGVDAGAGVDGGRRRRGGGGKGVGVGVGMVDDKEEDEDMRWTRVANIVPAPSVAVDVDSEPTTDSEPSPTWVHEGDDDRRRHHRRHHHHQHRLQRGVDVASTRATASGATSGYSRDLLAESDNLKWPMGQGWKPL